MQRVQPTRTKQAIRRVIAQLALSFLALLCAADAVHAQRVAEPRPPEAESRWTLGARGFVGAVYTEEARVGGGGGVIAAYGLVPERWELEAGLSVVAARDRAALGVFEVIGKLIIARHERWSPHLLLGPVFSLDFGDEVIASGGLVAGAGVTYWLSDRLGLVGDVAYRLLLGEEVEHIATLALGFNLRI